VFFDDPRELEAAHLERIEPARKSLRCSLCGRRGVCVQCAGGRCLVAYHPWCLVRAPSKVAQAFKPVDETDPSAGARLECYCSKHVGGMKRRVMGGPPNLQEALYLSIPKGRQGVIGYNVASASEQQQPDSDLQTLVQ
ncbi:unnamed protein product, partial [Discosporangium mesarthrocarpum]